MNRLERQVYLSSTEQAQVAELKKEKLRTRDMIEGMQLGTIDLAVINTPLLAGFDPRFQIFDMPFMFDDWKHVEKVVTSPIGAKAVLGS